MSMSLASSGSVKIIHGANDGIFNVVGTTVANVRESLIDAFNLPAHAVAFANMERVGDDFRLQADSTLQFVIRAGRKGVGEKVWAGEEFCQFFKLTTEDLQAWIAQGLKVRRCLDGSLRITETAVDEFFRGRVIESPYMNTEEAAAYCQTTVKGIYSMLETGKLKKCPGSRKCLFTKEMLEAAFMGEES